MGDEDKDAPWSASGAPDGSGNDLAEIRRRIALCFSIVELRRLAEDLGVTDIAWDRGMSEATRDLVRYFERRGLLVVLVEKLREQRPLLDWPLRGSGVMPAQAALPSFGGFGAGVAPPQPGSTQPGSTQPGSTQVEPTQVGAAGFSAAPNQVGATAGGAGPDTVPSSPQRVDPRLLLGAGAVMLVALLIAFVAGRASTPAQPSLQASAAPPPPGHRNAVAMRAAAAIAARAESVARACEIPPGAPDDVMRRAFVRCGPAAAPALPKAGGAGASPAAPQATPPDDGLPPRPPKPAAPATRVPVVAGNAPCLSACEQRHRACKANQCGREPTRSSQYKPYQDCLSTCLQQASKCRLGCP